jgi:hypothetical protein
VARIHPTDWRALEVTGAAAREIETLALLEAALPDSLTVLHGVHWSRLQAGFAAVGEVDFVVIGPDGRVLLVEQKSGLLEQTPEGLVKRYGGARRKHVGHQVDRMIDALRQRITASIRVEGVLIDYLLYCPDYTVHERASAGLPEERIVDLPRRDSLPRRIREAFTGPPRPDLARRLYEFFAGELELVPDTATLVGRAGELVTRLSGGLATWARRLEFEPFRLRVTATAGSGKTQLALALLAQAAHTGRRTRYVCYNRPLADHVVRVAPEGALASTFHQWCERSVRAAGRAPDFSRADAFATLERDFAALDPPSPLLDELVIDEGQDFEAAWVAPLLRQVRPEGRVWWLEDPMQQLYAREEAQLAGWVRLRDDTNYRTPRSILEKVNRWLSPAQPVVAGSPFEGEELEVLEYEDAAGLAEKTRRAITLALQSRFRRQDIAVVTFAGRERSRILAFDALGPHKLRSFQGRYDILGEPEFGEGEILAETVYRFKGQSAPCVILTEIDFETLDERARRKLFTGMTRASLKLYLVISSRALAQLPESA